MVALAAAAAVPKQVVLAQARKPVQDADGIMHVPGYFPSIPPQANFDHSHAPVSAAGRL